MASQQKALIIPTKQAPFEITTRDVPKPGSGQILVKIMSVGLNIVDIAIQTRGIVVEKYPFVGGFEAAGIVDEVGPGVAGFSKGDKVLHASAVTGDSDEGLFQHYSLVLAEQTAKAPESISFDQAATIPLCLATACIPMYSEKPRGLGLPPAWEASGRGKYAGQPFFVWGGSTSVGQFAIQLAKLSGFSPIIATASLHNAELLKSSGATHVLDRNLSAETIIVEVKKITDKPILHAYQAVSEGQQITYDVVASGGRIASVFLDENWFTFKPTEGKDVEFIVVYASFYLPIHRKLGLSLCAALPSLLAEGSIKPTPVEIVPDGLSGIFEALQRLLQKQVSGRKLVAHPQETV